MTLKIDAHGFWQTGFFGKMVRLTTVQGNRRSFADLMRINRVFTANGLFKCLSSGNKSKASPTIQKKFC
jgi:hypothetical protein